MESNSYTALMETLLSANGAEISKIGGFVKKSKIERIFISIFNLAWGLAVNHFPLFCWPRLKRRTSLLKTEQHLRAVLAAWSWGQILAISDGKPDNRRFYRGKARYKSPVWSGKTTDVPLASPLDCHKTARMIFYEDALLKTCYSCFLCIWNLVSNALLEFIFIFNFTVDGIIYTST
jgi:hypothetical protein